MLSKIKTMKEVVDKPMYHKVRKQLMYTSQIVNILCWACSGVSSTRDKDYEKIPYEVKTANNT